MGTIALGVCSARMHVHCCWVSPLKGLFRKVCLGEISPTDLVRMKSEQYASDELAEWREKTLKKVCTYTTTCALCFVVHMRDVY